MKRQNNTWKVIFAIFLLNLVLFMLYSNITLTDSKNDCINNVNVNDKLKISATEDWCKTWGENDDDDVAARVDVYNKTRDVYITGYIEDGVTGYFDAVLLKYNSSGDLQWDEIYDTSIGDMASGIAVNQSSGDIFIVGQTFIGSNFDILLLKYNSSGDLKWSKTWTNGTKHDLGFGIALSSSGYIYIAGTTDFYGKDDIVLIKFDSKGTVMWTRSWTGVSDDMGVNVAVDSMENIYICGISESAAYDYDVVILKYNSTGDLKWCETWGGENDDTTNSIKVDSLGNVYVTGNTESYGEQNDLYLLKYNSDGTELWYKTWKGFCYEGYCGACGNDMCINSSNIIYIASDVLYPPDCLSFIKYDTSGNRLKEGVWDGSDSYMSSICINIDLSGNVYLGGVIDTGPNGESDFILVKNPGLTIPSGAKEEEDDDDDDEKDKSKAPFNLLTFLISVPGLIIIGIVVATVVTVSVIVVKKRKMLERKGDLAYVDTFIKEHEKAKEKEKAKKSEDLEKRKKVKKEKIPKKVVVKEAVYSATIQCPRCGEILSSTTAKCPSCKWTPPPSAAPIAKAETTLIQPETLPITKTDTITTLEAESLNKCPSCGWILSKAATKCPKCKWTKESATEEIKPPAQQTEKSIAQPEVVPKAPIVLDKNQQIQLVNQEISKLYDEIEEINKKMSANLITIEESTEIKNKLYEKLGELEGKLTILQEK